MRSIPFVIRQLQASDAEPFSALRLRLTEENPVPMGLTLAEERTRPMEGFRLQLSAPAPSAAFGAFMGDTLVGCAAVAWTRLFASSRHKVTLWGTFVDPSSRRQGVGRALVAQALAHAKLNGARRANLTVYLPNANAVALYESLGFETYGTEPEAVHIDGRYFSAQLMGSVL